MSKFKKMIREVIQCTTWPVRKQKLKKLSTYGLPTSVYPAINYLVDKKYDSETEQVVNKIETIRSNIASKGDQKLEILYSPKPYHSTSNNEYISSEFRPQHGEQKMFTMERIAKTGKNKIWGTVLYLLARENKAKVILELGSCAGISGAYLASSKYCEVLHTIEGSTPLAQLASETISQVSSNFKVHNSLFDDALDNLLPDINQIDLAFIDGHHEKLATIHYWKKIAPKMRPGGLVIFDDISWSHDMRECWNFLARQADFSHAMDLGSIGVCICGAPPPPPHTHTQLQHIGICSQ